MDILINENEEGSWAGLRIGDALGGQGGFLDIAEAVVRETGAEPRNPRGEERACGDGVNCETVQIIVAAGRTVTAVRREVAEINDDWAENLPWCWWEGAGQEALPDGRTRMWARLKNWKHDRSRRIRLMVWSV